MLVADSFCIAHGRDRWRAAEESVMSLRLPSNPENYLEAEQLSDSGD
jgi:hypothetical protein